MTAFRASAIALSDFHSKQNQRESSNQRDKVITIAGLRERWDIARNRGRFAVTVGDKFKDGRKYRTGTGARLIPRVIITYDPPPGSSIPSRCRTVFLPLFCREFFLS